MKRPLLLLASIATLPLTLPAANIDRATLTEVVNSVSIIDRSTKKSASAKVQQLFDAPNVLRTGSDSRAEMISADQTVTRVGQNTLFSFQPDSREINLDKGSILFQSPSGKGGGTIRTSAASAAVLGTTLIVSSTKNGGFKVLLLEGTGKVSGAGGTRKLNAGQLVYALPGGRISNVFSFQLREQTGASKLVRGFKRPLPSMGKIADAISAQEKEISSGKVRVTGLLASGSPDYAYQLSAAYETQGTEQKQTEAAQSPFAAAVSSDAVVASPALDKARLFGPGFEKNEFATPPMVFDSQGDQPTLRAATAPVVFLGNNITFDTDSVNLAPFAGRDLFQFFATSDISLERSMDFGSFSGQLSLAAGGTIRNQPGITLRAASDVFTILAYGHGAPLTDMPVGQKDVLFEKTLTLERLNLINRTGHVLIAGGNMDLRAVQIAAAKRLKIATSGSLNLDRATDMPDVSLPVLFSDGGALPLGYSNLASPVSVAIDSAQDATIRNTSVRAPRIAIRGNNVTLNRVRLTDGTKSINPNSTRPPMPNSATVRLRAENLLSISGVRFGANDMYLQARTIALADTNFRDGSRVWLESRQGVLAANPNTNSPAIPGQVNFVRNVRYGGNVIRSSSDPVILQNGAPSGTNGTPQGPGIVIRPLGR